MVKRKKSSAEIAYDKQVKRIKQFISRAEKRGYVFEENVLPQKPKRITKASVRKLAKITPKELYKKAVYGGEATGGEIVAAKEGLKLERSLRSKKSAESRKKKRDQQYHKQEVHNKPEQESTNTPGFEPPFKQNDDYSFYTRVVITQWYETLGTFSNGEAYNLLRAWMGSIIRENGLDDVAVMISEASADGYLLTWDVVYKSDYAVQYLANLINYLPEAGVLYKEEMLDRIEYMKAVGEALEQDENWEYPL